MRKLLIGIPKCSASVVSGFTGIASLIALKMEPEDAPVAKSLTGEMLLMTKFRMSHGPNRESEWERITLWFSLSRIQTMILIMHNGCLRPKELMGMEMQFGLEMDTCLEWELSDIKILPISRTGETSP